VAPRSTRGAGSLAPSMARLSGQRTREEDSKLSSVDISLRPKAVRELTASALKLHESQMAHEERGMRVSGTVTPTLEEKQPSAGSGDKTGGSWGEGTECSFVPTAPVEDASAEQTHDQGRSPPSREPPSTNEKELSLQAMHATDVLDATEGSVARSRRIKSCEFDAREMDQHLYSFRRQRRRAVSLTFNDIVAEADSKSREQRSRSCDLDDFADAVADALVEAHSQSFNQKPRPRKEKSERTSVLG